MIKEYATKTEVTYRNNVMVPGFWPVGIDYGFSSVKGFSPNKIFCYPNCAVRTKSFDSLLDSTDRDILLSDAEGCWLVGARAHEAITPAEAMNYEAEMYERNRYFSPAFRALMKVGLGIALLSNPYRTYDEEMIVVQTGLPPEYRELDTEAITEALAGDYDFDLKVGKAPFRHFHFTVFKENVFVMDQPMGSLFSAITDNDGLQGQAGLQVLKSSTIVFDPGFKTLDIYDISGGMFKGSNTFDNLGMHEVFLRTIQSVKSRCSTNMTVLGMQEALRRGYITSFDRRKMETKRIAFDADLENSSRAVCEEALKKVVSLYNYLQNHDNLIVTGGTGDAWYPMVRDYFRNMESLHIIRANCNDISIPNVYSNVRGYYYRLIGMLRHRYKK